MRKLAVISLILSLLAIALVANARTEAEIPAPPVIGATVANFTLPDASGASHSLDSLKGTKGSVLIFIAVQCPVSNAYNERMEKLAMDYRAKGISVVGINANSTEDAVAVKNHAAEKHLTFTILKDTGNKIADRLGASKTPEAYFLDASNKLLYHGRIDNSKEESGVNSSELRDALDATLAGKPVEKTTATAFGCSIKRS